MSVALTIGDQVGSYRIVRELGQGGMGTVYEVEHIKLGVHYALKTFTLDDEHAALFRERFLAEGKVLARLSHPNIARVFDLDYDEASGFAYFVMDLVHYKDGASYTLADLDVGGADEDHLIRWFGQLASALDYIHREGIVHRDIKLNNILLNDKSGVTLSDFGISKFVGDRIRSEIKVEKTIVSMSARQVTGNLIMGTEGYMAPEIERGEAATAASDTYALGVTFFRLLTGIWYEPGTNVLKLLEPFDAVWMEILPKMLDEKPSNRPIWLEQLAKQLKESSATAAVTSVRTQIRSEARRTNQRMRWLAGGLGAAAVLAVCAFVWHYQTTSEEPDYSHIYDIPECIL